MTGSEVLIRDATPDDDQDLYRLICAAFGQKQEADLVRQLARDGDLALSLVAEQNEKLVGQVSLSHLRSPIRGLALAPVSVASELQGKGIGTKLIEAALERAGPLGGGMVFVLGEPAFYGRFGFSAKTAAAYPCPYAGPYFLALELTTGRSDPAQVIYADAFSNL